MALFRAVETAQPPQHRLFSDPFAIPLLSGKLKLFAQLAHVPIAGRLVPAFLDRGWPYTRSSAVIRTRLIDDLVREAIRTGAQQLVLLGAGFDSRPCRLEEAKTIPTFEVDHPATQRAKRQRLSTLNPLPANIRFLEVDFESDDLEATLQQSGFNKHSPAIVVWEGVVSYLTEPAVDANFNILARLLAPGSSLIFTYVDKRAIDGTLDFAGSSRWKSWVNRSGEPFIFGFTPATLASTLAAYGFHLELDESTAESAQRYNTSIQRNEPGSTLYRVAAATRTGA
jgi:methyltransferase (TIGR00027 family)